MLPQKSNMPSISPTASRRDILKALVDWIQKDFFAVGKSNRKGGISYKWSSSFPIIKGWDERLKQYAYATATPTPAFSIVRSNIAQIISDLQSPSTFIKGATATIEWGGLRPNSYNFAETGNVISYSQKRGGTIPPMNSGWTKVAALASMGNSAISDQSIWDSRMSTSIIHRLDLLANLNNTIWSNICRQLCLSNTYLVTSGRGGTRRGLRVYSHYMSKNTYQPTTWDSHFWGSQIVLELVDILNNKSYKYPRMPYYDSKTCSIILKDWDVFGVGMVLFMDGY